MCMCVLGGGGGEGGERMISVPKVSFFWPIFSKDISSLFIYIVFLTFRRANYFFSPSSIVQILFYNFSPPPSPGVYLATSA